MSRHIWSWGPGLSSQTQCLHNIINQKSVFWLFWPASLPDLLTSLSPGGLIVLLFLLRLMLTLLCTGVCLCSNPCRAEDISCGLLDSDSHQGWPLQTPLLYQGWLDTLEYCTVDANMNRVFLCLKVMSEQRSNVCRPLLLEWLSAASRLQKKRIAYTMWQKAKY